MLNQVARWPRLVGWSSLVVAVPLLGLICLGCLVADTDVDRLRAMRVGFYIGVFGITVLGIGIAMLRVGRGPNAMAKWLAFACVGIAIVHAVLTWGFPKTSVRLFDAAAVRLGHIPPDVLASSKAQWHCQRADRLRVQGSYDQAIAEYGEAIAAVPGSVRAYSGRAAAWQAKRHYDKAWADIQHCREYGGTPAPGLVESLIRDSGRSE